MENLMTNSRSRQRKLRENCLTTHNFRECMHGTMISNSEFPKSIPIVQPCIPQKEKELISESCLETPLSVPNGQPASLIQHAANLIEVHNLTDEPFFITDLGAVTCLYDHITQAMPRVLPHFAVKCFPEKGILSTLAQLGAGFDCASQVEAKEVLALGVDPSRIIFANPCKRISCLHTIAQKNIPLTTFDSVGELKKIKQHCPDVGVVLRIRADDPLARISFGVKYGANPLEFEPLVLAAKRLGLRVAGVSFHVGSGAEDATTFEWAIGLAKQVFDLVLRHGMPECTVLDVGGGFNGGFDVHGNTYLRTSSSPHAPSPALAINRALERHFPISHYPELRVISEPGRYFAEASASLVTSVIGRRVRRSHAATTEYNPHNEAKWECANKEIVSDMDELEEDIDAGEGEREWVYYLSDGIYGNLNGIVYDAATPTAVPFRVTQDPEEILHTTHTTRASFFGPTCDSLDMVIHKVSHVPVLDVGDWLLFPRLGAYSMAGAVDFNGIPATAQAGVKTFYIKSQSFETTSEDMELPVIATKEAPLEVRKNF